MKAKNVLWQETLKPIVVLLLIRPKGFFGHEM